MQALGVDFERPHLHSGDEALLVLNAEIRAELLFSAISIGLNSSGKAYRLAGSAFRIPQGALRLSGACLEHPETGLGYLMYRSALVPRAMAVLGLIGGSLAVASTTAVLFGLYEQVLVSSFIATLPEIAWEASPGIYFIVKGFKPSPITSGDTRHGVDEGSPAPAAAAG